VDGWDDPDEVQCVLAGYDIVIPDDKLQELLDTEEDEESDEEDLDVMTPPSIPLSGGDGESGS
jgi:hypothetical protein